ncbi:MAG TPA: DUF167 domain-containing protein [Syntrophorhabdus sp.]|jgi:uncharacterized protein (TIGR00251 family)|nr:DUF167 domain-containing protein [Syntrophorhabdus sp.]MDI9558843.1 DUF167 domain-containing protein [Pseudomonadota bacterium]OPX97150.1 MAG: hypothetical protein A4E59_00822 [Syntrophorhabdus sp. PtaB.Bin027]OQB75774.1 MAG: hypothetical protein BWX92_02416 [Deltaproteobacteria bacterium ADurb.Bin135]MBP8744959.1 DUF167 domain-containing protein [Syntrophorhabdus sp.]
MIIEVRVITNAKKKELKFEGDSLKVKITALPKEGRANTALIEYLADFFGVKRSEVKIIKGEKEKRKLISLPLEEEQIAKAMGR